MAAATIAADVVVKMGKAVIVNALPGKKCPLSPFTCYIVELAAAGAVLHLVSEAIGANDWLLRNSAAAAAAVAGAPGLWAPQSIAKRQNLTPPRVPLPTLS